MSLGSLQVRPATDTVTFRARAEPYLLRDEAGHNLLLGILSTITDDPTAFSSSTPYLVTIESDSSVVGVALMTPPHNLVLSKLERLDAVFLLVDALIRDGVHVPGVIAPAPMAEHFVRAWADRTGQAMERAMRQGIYRMTRVNQPPDVEGTARVANPGDRELLIEWTMAFAQEAGLHADRLRVQRDVDRKLGGRESGYYLWEVAGMPVAVAGYGGRTPNGARIGPVYTPPAHRRRGYGTAATAETSRRLLDGGRTFCFLYTDLANPTSNSIYQKIGYEWVCESAEWRLPSRLAAPSTPQVE